MDNLCTNQFFFCFSIEAAPAPAPVEPVELPENTNSERGVYVSWPKKVMGLYILLADDDHEGYERLPELFISK